METWPATVLELKPATRMAYTEPAATGKLTEVCRPQKSSRHRSSPAPQSPLRTVRTVSPPVRPQVETVAVPLPVAT